MKKLFTLFILLTSLSIYAQDFEITPNVIDFNLDGTSEVNKIGYTLKNNTDTNLNWYWTLTLDDDFPKEWAIQVCDQTLCWDFGTLERGIEDEGNVLMGGSETDPFFTYANVDPKGIAGSGTVQFCIYDDKEYTSEVICTSFSTSVSIENIVDMTIYPNPASETMMIDLQVAESSNVSYRVIDILGKTIENRLIGQNITGKMSLPIDVSSYQNGTYLVFVKVGEKEGVRRISVMH